MLKMVSVCPSDVDEPMLRGLYTTAFPEEEQIPYDDLKHLLQTMPIDYDAYYDGDVFVGLTIVLRRDDFNWLGYFAVVENLRGMGYGQQILNELKRKYASGRLMLDMESPRQENCSNRKQRVRRHDFYIRNGFRDTPTLKSFKGIDYTILMLGDGEFCQRDYDGIINDLRKFWENIPAEDSK